MCRCCCEGGLVLSRSAGESEGLARVPGGWACGYEHQGHAFYADSACVLLLTCASLPAPLHDLPCTGFCRRSRTRLGCPSSPTSTRRGRRRRWHRCVWLWWCGGVEWSALVWGARGAPVVEPGSQSVSHSAHPGVLVGSEVVQVCVLVLCCAVAWWRCHVGRCWGARLGASGAAVQGQGRRPAGSWRRAGRRGGSAELPQRCAGCGVSGIALVSHAFSSTLFPPGFSHPPPQVADIIQIPAFLCRQVRRGGRRRVVRCAMSRGTCPAALGRFSVLLRCQQRRSLTAAPRTLFPAPWPDRPAGGCCQDRQSDPDQEGPVLRAVGHAQ